MEKIKYYYRKFYKQSQDYTLNEVSSEYYILIQVLSHPEHNTLLVFQESQIVQKTVLKQQNFKSNRTHLKPFSPA